MLLLCALAVSGGCGGTDELLWSGIDNCDEADKLRCSPYGERRQLCTLTPGGSYLWVDQPGCTGSLVCDDGECVCPPGCDDQDSVRCVEERLEVCEPNADGCLLWVLREDCGASDLRCVAGDHWGQCGIECQTECVPGERRCVGSRIDECFDAGCPHWREEERCSDDQLDCVDGPNGPVCEGACPTDSCVDLETRCNGSLVEECSVNAWGCTVWHVLDDCEYASRVCAVQGDEARCIAACGAGCQPDRRRCNGAVVERCHLAGDQCTVWNVWDDCTESGGICVERWATAACEQDPCTDPCPTLGERRCQADRIQECRDQDICSNWTDVADCTATGERCLDSSGGPECVCAGECPAEGDLRCNDQGQIERCELGAAGCLAWALEMDCPLWTGQVCDDSSGTPQCRLNCTDQCTGSANRCATGSELIETCTMMPTGCREWVAGEDCALAGATCDPTTGVARCYIPCINECPTAAATRCEPGTESYQMCVIGADGCLDWAHVQDCSATGMLCAEAGGSANCECPPSCPAEFDTQCAGDVLQRCNQQANSCLQWEDERDCTLDGATCEPTPAPAQCVVPCSDECPAENDTRCYSTAIQTCTRQPSGCLDWSLTEDCLPTNRTCDDSGGAPVCVCQHVCNTLGEIWCQGQVALECVTDVYSCRTTSTVLDCGQDNECYMSGPTTADCRPAIPLGDSCQSPEAPKTLPYTLAGSEFGSTSVPGDYTDALDYGASPGCTPAAGAELVIELDTLAGQTLTVQESLGVDVVIRILDACDPASAQCLLSQDAPELLNYPITVDGKLWVVVESLTADPPARDYDVFIGLR